MLLRAALLDGARASESWDRWRAVSDRPEARRGLHWLGPLLVRNLSDRGCDPEIIELRRIHESRARDRARRRHALELLLARLERAGIDTLVLKGASVGRLDYRDESLRPMTDLDVLVPAARAFAAIDVLRASAAIPLTPIPERPHDLRWRHSTVLALGDVPIDLHWHVLPECCADDDDASFWRFAVPLRTAVSLTRALAPAHRLMHAFAQGTRVTRSPAPRWVADCAMILRASGSDIDWDLLVRECEQRRLVIPVREGLEYVRGLLEVPVSDVHLAALRHVRTRWLDERAFVARGRVAAYRSPIDAVALLVDEHRRRARAGAVAHGPGGFLAATANEWRASAGPGRAMLQAPLRIAGRFRQWLTSRSFRRP